MGLWSNAGSIGFELGVVDSNKRFELGVDPTLPLFLRRLLPE
jgi:hypothetical protein